DNFDDRKRAPQDHKPRSVDPTVTDRVNNCFQRPLLISSVRACKAPHVSQPYRPEARRDTIT
ncbi:unnamed protein product, partial [Musa acuminata subsp. burmannicoides]